MAINYTTQQSYGTPWDNPWAQQPTQSTPNPFPTPAPPQGVIPTTTYQPGGVSPFSGLVKQAYAADNGGGAVQSSAVPNPNLGYHTQEQGGQSVMGSRWQDYPGYAGWGEKEAELDFAATGGAGKGGGGGTPASPTPEQQLMTKTPTADIGNFDLKADEFMNEINSQYNERMGYLSKAEEAIRLGQPEILEGIAADLKAGKSQVETGKQKELGVLSGSEKEATGRKEDVLASSRRLYDELRRGGQQRFGGASSAGGAMSELLGVEQQRQAGLTGREYSRAMDQISTQKADIESQYQSTLLQLESENKNAQNQANQEFRSRLDEINQNRLLASDAKGQARLGVLTDLRDKMFSIEQQKTQFQQQLEQMRQEQTLSLDTYAKQLQMAGASGQQAATGFNQATTTSPTSDITATGRQSTQPVGIGSAVGQIGNYQSNKDLPLWMQGQ